MHYPKGDEFAVPSVPMQAPPSSQLPPHYPMINGFTAPSAPMQAPQTSQQPPHYPKANEFTAASAPMQVPPPSQLSPHYPKADEFTAPSPPMQVPPQSQLPPHLPMVNQFTGPYAPMQVPYSPLQQQQQVAIGVPPVGVPPMQYQVPGTWTTGLFDCFNDIDSCCLTFWCPCITFGRVSHISSKGVSSCAGSSMLWCCLLTMGLSCTGCGWQWIYSMSSRSNLRAQYNLPEDPCCDCCVHFCCEACSLCQIYRELQNRGFDMSLGYQVNVEKLNRGVMQPPVPGTMTR